MRCTGPIGRGLGILGVCLLSRSALAEIDPAKSAQKTQGTRAESSAAEAAEPVTRPVPRGALPVSYPEGQTTKARVILELLVDRDGRVREAKVVEGGEPFAEAALDASAGFQFEPARRGGEPVPAKIRLEVRFEPPAPVPGPVPNEQAGGQPAPGAEERRRTPKASIEILVLGERAAPGRSSFGRAEVRELPGAFGDPFRAVEVMPGVTPIFTGVPFFFVRGSPPGNVGYFLDGIRVPLLFHVALGPSVVHPGLVERVDLYPGGYPARYGRFAGAVIAAETTAPNTSLHGEANLRVFDAGAMVEGPFAEGRGSALVGGRYSYTAAVLSLIAPDVTLSYWDYQARISYDLSSAWRIGAFAFGAYDSFRSDTDQGSVGTQFHRLDLRADLRVSPATRVGFAVTVGFDRSAAEEIDGDEVRSSPALQDGLWSARLKLNHRLGQQGELRAGAEVGLDRYQIVDIASEDPQAADVFYSRDDLSVGLHADLAWEPEPWVVVTPGFRLDAYRSSSQTRIAFEPRIAAEFELSRFVRLEHTLGVAHQAPSFVAPIPGFQLSDLEDGLQQSVQSSAGAVLRPGSGLQIGVTLFHSIFLNLTDYLGTVSLRDYVFEQIVENDDEDRLDLRSRGQAYGLEVSLKRPLTERLGGYLAYTLSRSTRRLAGTTLPSDFDRTQVLHAALAYDLGRHWRAGARFSLYTGPPAQRESSFFNPNGTARKVPPQRAPIFHRLDLRLEKRWPIGTDGRYWSFVLEVLNSTLRREVANYQCRPEGCSGDEIGPVTIPSIGAEVFF